MLTAYDTAKRANSRVFHHIRIVVVVVGLIVVAQIRDSRALLRFSRELFVNFIERSGN